MLPGQDIAAGQALIAEARARARRRRQKITLALTAAAAVLSAAGVLTALTLPGRSHHAGAPAPAGAETRTGTVIGHYGETSYVPGNWGPYVQVSVIDPDG
jgi:hypothetical protein